MTDDELDRLRVRVEELERENAELREQLREARDLAIWCWRSVSLATKHVVGDMSEFTWLEDDQS